MNAAGSNKPEETGGFTPAKLAARKLTLADMPPSAYDHETQTRKYPDGETPVMDPDTLFDGEKT